MRPGTARLGGQYLIAEVRVSTERAAASGGWEAGTHRPVADGFYPVASISLTAAFTSGSLSSTA